MYFKEEEIFTLSFGVFCFCYNLHLQGKGSFVNNFRVKYKSYKFNLSSLVSEF